MDIAYARTPLPKSIFLAGPTPRDDDTRSWRPTALELIRSEGFEGTVFVPENSNGSASFTYDGQVEWELQALHSATVILFWVPRMMKNMPALTTNVEFGHFIARPNVVIGIPADAERCKYLHSMARMYNHFVHLSLPAACRAAVALTERPFQTGGV